MSRPYNQILLEDIAIPKGIQTGPFGSQLKAEEYVDVGIPVVMPKDILGGFLSSETVARISETKARKLKKHKIISGDIIFPRRGDLRRIGVARDENNGWICGSGCLRARVKNDVFPGYLHQYLQLDSVGKWLERNALGQTMLNLNTEIISKMPITLPSLPEQKAIADLLSTWDEAIEKTERLIQAKEKRFQWLLRTLISEPQNTRNTRKAEQERPLQCVQCIPWLEKEPQNTQNTRKGTAWKKVKIGSFLTESRIPDHENNPEKRLSVRLHLKGVEIRECRGTESDAATAYFVRKAGQFIYGKQNIFRGSVGIVPPELDGYCSTQDIPAFDVSGNVCKDWLLFLFSCPDFYKRLELYASGSGSKRLHPKELFKMTILLPPFY